MPNTREKLIEIEQATVWFEKRAKDTPMPGARKMFEIGAEVLREKVNGVTVQEWISIEAGELQNYIGVPVCIKRKTDGECWWAIIRGINGDKVSTDYDGYFKLSEYGETWMVKYLPLPQPPKGE